MLGRKEKVEYTGVSAENTQKQAVIIVGVEIFIIFILSIGLLFVLNYFRIFPLSEMNPALFGLFPVKSITNEILVNQTEIFSCPVPLEFCDKGMEVEFNGEPALIYDIDSGSDVDTLSFYVLQTKKYALNSMHGFSQTFIYNNFCYTASYLFSSDSKLEPLDEFSLGPDAKLSVAGEEDFFIAGKRGNVLIQLQKRPLDQHLVAKKEVESCTLIDREKEEYGEYERLNNAFFGEKMQNP